MTFCVLGSYASTPIIKSVSTNENSALNTCNILHLTKYYKISSTTGPDQTFYTCFEHSWKSPIILTSFQRLHLWMSWTDKDVRMAMELTHEMTFCDLSDRYLPASLFNIITKLASQLKSAIRSCFAKENNSWTVLKGRWLGMYIYLPGFAVTIPNRAFWNYEFPNAFSFTTLRFSLWSLLDVFKLWD